MGLFLFCFHRIIFHPARFNFCMKFTIVPRIAASLGVLAFSTNLSNASPCYDDSSSIVVEARFGYDEPVYSRPAPPPPPRYQRHHDCVEVRAQQRLRKLGYYYGSIDGIFGYGSRRALIHFQEDEGLRVTGRLDRYTLEALRIY